MQGGASRVEQSNRLLSQEPEWVAAAVPPPAYTIVLLSFVDGSVRRGVWNGKMWWGYDERVKRARELHPLRWQVWDDTSPRITRSQRLTGYSTHDFPSRS